ncbi:serine hydrolase [Rarobacter incanus]|uniref:CubicO group peptidase (Beta-lactamase class C family) n=1 Tax=Rarobacter incanus TaxID=153494 RepID=A0A542SNY4_9MICO|nr:serine hydrolase [Rarobacter incanus]TQK76292.1 CubicO group peptidase (beta-lactamase class C family) [Rarobacter incanus]
MNANPARPRRLVAAIAATSVLLGALVAAPATSANAADPSNWPLIVTQIVPNNAGTDNFEYFQLYNTTDAPIDLATSGYQLGYSSNYTLPASTRTDYNLTVSGTTTTVAPHSSLVLWNKYNTTQLAMDDQSFRDFWAAQNPAAPTDYALGYVTGTNGISNSESRGIRVVAPDNSQVSYAFDDNASYGDNKAAVFRIPANPAIKQLELLYPQALAAPGALFDGQLADRDYTAGAPTSENLDGLVDTNKISDMLSRMHLMGTVLVVKNGAVTTVSNGFADAENEVPNSRDTLFATASLEKAMTATLIKQLIDAGKLSFDDTLGEFYPQVPSADSITIRNLLEHTSGIRMPEMPVYVDDSDPSQGEIVLETQEEQIAHAIDSITIVNQGSWSYSNGNYTMLAAIASKIENEPFEKLMQERVFAPAGMNDTYFWDTIPAAKQDRVAKEYKYQNGDYSTEGGPVATASLQSTLLGAGNVFTTIDDLLKFYRESNGGAILSQDSYAELSKSSLQNGYAGGLYHYVGVKRARGSASTDVAGGRYNSFVYGSENNDDLVLILSNQSYISGNPAPLTGYDQFAESIYLDLVADPTIDQIDTTALTTSIGQAPTLPAKVNVSFVGDVKDKQITVDWDPVPASAYAQAGTYTVTGSLVGLHGTAVATVVVAAAPTGGGTPVVPGTGGTGNSSVTKTPVKVKSQSIKVSTNVAARKAAKLKLGKKYKLSFAVPAKAAGAKVTVSVKGKKVGAATVSASGAVRVTIKLKKGRGLRAGKAYSLKVKVASTSLSKAASVSKKVRIVK